ncbi:GTP cyclohydrolase I [Halobacteria archaeon AArc-m2/3/4]|uniref:GTP cyclohydrolase I n=1 Tax=Natronoglomus mannanivorans TaxID=2979990 RepID=A0ABT2QLN7_9EURY|nr:GTP cyclohydrolase I [Halobacteria archaeon AArc-m2/3/4]
MTNQHQSAQTTVDSRGIDWEQAQRATRLLLESLGENPDREGLTETWQRRLPASLETLTEGQRETAKPDMRTFEAETDDLVIKTGIPVYSLCEHHMLPYHGTAHIGYRPDETVVGLSKLSRYVRWQSRRLTIQEGLTREIADGLAEEVHADGVVVELTATHLCEAMRGVETATETTTQATVGNITATDRQRFRAAIDNHE